MNDLAGHKLDCYVIEKEIGRGGMATVFRARDTRSDRLCAIKVINSNFGVDDHYMKRFLREGRATAALNHPHIIEIYDIGEADGRHYIAMPYYSGPALHEMLQEGWIDYDLISKYLSQAADALDFAHENSIVHRDVKPSNMLVNEKDDLILTDFGIAAQINDPSATTTGSVIGTPAYITPEQIRGQQVSAQTDIYQLGATAYELLTGSQPFGDRPTNELMYVAHLEEMPTPVHDLRTELSPTINEIINIAMAKKPEDRFETATEFINRLIESLQVYKCDDSLSNCQIEAHDPELTIVEPEPDINSVNIVPIVSRFVGRQDYLTALRVVSHLETADQISAFEAIGHVMIDQDKLDDAERLALRINHTPIRNALTVLLVEQYLNQGASDSASKFILKLPTPQEKLQGLELAASWMRLSSSAEVVNDRFNVEGQFLETIWVNVLNWLPNEQGNPYIQRVIDRFVERGEFDDRLERMLANPKTTDEIMRYAVDKMMSTTKTTDEIMSD